MVSWQVKMKSYLMWVVEYDFIHSIYSQENKHLCWICSVNVFMLKTHLYSENVLLPIFWKLQKICISNSENWTVFSRQCGGFLDYLQRQWSSQWLNNQEINGWLKLMNGWWTEQMNQKLKPTKQTNFTTGIWRIILTINMNLFTRIKEI